MRKTMQLMGKKEGMTQQFDEKGSVVACTVIRVEPHVVVAIRTQEKEGYNALQLGFDKIVTKDPRTLDKRINRPLKGHFEKAKAPCCRHLMETKVEKVEDYALGQEISLSLFSDVGYVDIVGKSKGKGFQGVIKRYHFAGGPAAHGSSFHRHGGSTGMRSTPGRNLPMVKKAGRMGGEWVTLQNMKVLGVDVERSLLIVEGAIPGANGGVVYFTPSIKKGKKEKR